MKTNASVTILRKILQQIEVWKIITNCEETVRGNSRNTNSFGQALKVY